jgi:tRNA(Phe) wybutosine-synthesizing methylase Tyw3
MSPTIKALHRLTTPAHAEHGKRHAALDVFGPRVRFCRDVHARLMAEYSEVARQANALNVKALVRVLRPDLLHVVAKLLESAKGIIAAGSLAEVAEAYTAAYISIDTATANEFARHCELVDKLVQRAEGAVRDLQAHVYRLVDALETLEPETSNLAADVIVTSATK